MITGRRNQAAGARRKENRAGLPAGKPERGMIDMGNERNGLIAYCGVDCGACPDYEKGICPSCRLTAWKEGDTCMPVRCCREKGIDFCGLCREFPCGDMAEFYEESDGHRKAFERMLAARRDRKG